MREMWNACQYIEKEECILQYNFAAEIWSENMLYKINQRKMCVSNKRIIPVSN